MASLTFFAIVALYMIRVCLYISMTLMVRPIAATNDTNFVDEFACPAALDERLSTSTHHNQSSLMAGQDGSVQQNLHQLDWDQEKQGLIFSSFYMGYTVMQLPVGIIVERAGGKPIILISLYFSALLSILTPVAIAWGDAPALFPYDFCSVACRRAFFPPPRDCWLRGFRLVNAVSLAVYSIAVDRYELSIDFVPAVYRMVL